jgi:hypothetical protein
LYLSTSSNTTESFKELGALLSLIRYELNLTSVMSMVHTEPVT